MNSQFKFVVPFDRGMYVYGSVLGIKIRCVLFRKHAVRHDVRFFKLEMVLFYISCDEKKVVVLIGDAFGVAYYEQKLF